MTKGKQLFIEGRLQTRRYEDGEGVSRMVPEVVVTTLRVFGGPARDTEGETASDSAGGAAVDSDRDETPL